MKLNYELLKHELLPDIAEQIDKASEGLKPSQRLEVSHHLQAIALLIDLDRYEWAEDAIKAVARLINKSKHERE